MERQRSDLVQLQDVIKSEGKVIHNGSDETRVFICHTYRHGINETLTHCSFVGPLHNNKQRDTQ